MGCMKKKDRFAYLMERIFRKQFNQNRDVDTTEC